MLCCADDLLATVAAVTVSRFASGTAIFTFLRLLFLDPFREATDPLFEFHVLVASNWLVRNKRNDVMFRMALLPEPTAEFAINLPEFVTDDTTMLELPEGLLQLPVSTSLFFVKLQAGFLQFQEGVTEFVEINLWFDRTLLGETFDPEKKV